MHENLEGVNLSFLFGDLTLGTSVNSIDKRDKTERNSLLLAFYSAFPLHNNNIIHYTNQKFTFI